MKNAYRDRVNRPLLSRMDRIHEWIQSGKYPNCVQMARDMGVAVRTVKRDVEYMRDTENMPIGYDEKKYGFYYTKKVDRFPRVMLSEAETFALLVAQKAIAQYRGTPFERPLEQAFRRLTGQLDREVAFSMGDLDAALSFHPYGPGDADAQAFEVLARGVREQRAVTFQYRNHGALQAQARRVHPYHLAHVDGRWCLFAFDVQRQGMRTFVLTRLRGPKLTAVRFKVAKKFDLKEYLRASFGLYKGKEGENYEVVVDLDAWASDEVRGRRWHESQELVELGEGRLRVAMRLSNIEEVEKWVMGFGTHATVISPATLRERLAKTGEEWGARYAGERSEARGQKPE